MRRSLVAFLLGICFFGCGGDSSPTPTPSAATRVIGLIGNLAFGDVLVGETRTSTLTITNSGNATLTVTGMTGPSGGVYTSSFTNGTIPAGGSQSATIFFAPTAAQNYSGSVTVNGDQTSGTNSIPISGRGTLTPRLAGVIRTESGSPLASVRVTFVDGANQGKFGITGTDGAYQITDLSNGGYTVVATLAGYIDLAKPVGINGPSTLDFALRRVGSPSPTPPPTNRQRIGAKCNDGTTSDATGSGACSHHNGVRCWLYSDGSCTNP